MKDKAGLHNNKQKIVDLFDICVVIPVQNNEKYLLEIFHGVTTSHYHRGK